ncbi:hypothetical protein H6G06_02055 [Anabaena sphaerica FACHB-251]|uniref:Uncharacterized protein n=1 Tax=Anabaena sphaerica FACHB-251 TaxID=2692883 RepID=A0A926ZZ95_9NOST|nr:hypothetical protein [Anabaena sphaerica]MBD2292296.1 hypothetical protein [Anabaena sphaerica FACHB-251]
MDNMPEISLHPIKNQTLFQIRGHSDFFLTPPPDSYSSRKNFYGLRLALAISKTYLKITALQKNSLPMDRGVL